MTTKTRTASPSASKTATCCTSSYWKTTSGASGYKKTARQRWTGRPRASRDGFTCPPVTINETADGLTVSGSRLRLHIRRPLQLIWEALEHGAWQPLAADRPTGAYELGRRRDDIAHYMTHDDRDRYYGLGEKAGTIDRSGKKYQMRSLDALGYNAETTDPLYKHWPYYQVRSAAGAHYGVFYDNLNTARFNMGNEIEA